MTILCISYNVASSSNLAGLNILTSLFNPTLIFLQEICLTTEQILARIQGYYDALSNLDEHDSRKPGTAIIWRKEINAQVRNVVPLRLQLLESNMVGNFVNVYAQTGTQGEKQRNSLFSRDLFSLINTTNPKPVLVGDWNSLCRKEDLENWETLGVEGRQISQQLNQLLNNFSYHDAFLIKDRKRSGFSLRRKGRRQRNQVPWLKLQNWFPKMAEHCKVLRNGNTVHTARTAHSVHEEELRKN